MGLSVVELLLLLVVVVVLVTKIHSTANGLEWLRSLPNHQGASRLCLFSHEENSFACAEWLSVGGPFRRSRSLAVVWARQSSHLI